MRISNFDFNYLNVQIAKKGVMKLDGAQVILVNNCIYFMGAILTAPLHCSKLGLNAGIKSFSSNAMPIMEALGIQLLMPVAR